ncbi:hypothetical protein, partial [Thalassobaculum sp.]|uniref:hypothetical protein n=1 Tax=Thalassobaculum sp. TaxID=2022740 RepID=UPI0032EC7688
MTDIGNRWDDTYAARADNEVSWYQALPERSLAMIQAAAPESVRMHPSTVCVASGRSPARSGGEGDAAHRRAVSTPSGGLPDATRRAGLPRPSAASARVP